MGDTSSARGWTYYDYWDLVPQTEFTNSAIHLTPFGETLLADRIKAEMLASFSLLQQ